MKRFLRQAAYVICALGVGCYACVQSDEWKTLNGEPLYVGTHESRLGQADDLRSMAGPVSVEPPHMFGSSEYTIELHGAGEFEFLAFYSIDRPKPGRYRVIAIDGTRLFGGDFRAVLSWSQLGSLSTADSGHVVLRRADGGLDGSYVLYLSEQSMSPPSSRPSVARGTFRLR
jgi:hypothetical protein